MHGASIQHGSCSPLGGAGWSEQSCPMWRAVRLSASPAPSTCPGLPGGGRGSPGTEQGQSCSGPCRTLVSGFFGPCQSCDMTCHVSRCGSLPWGHKKQEGALSPLTNLGQCRRGRTMQGPVLYVWLARSLLSGSESVFHLRAFQEHSSVPHCSIR